MARVHARDSWQEMLTMFQPPPPRPQLAGNYPQQEARALCPARLGVSRWAGNVGGLPGRVLTAGFVLLPAFIECTRTGAGHRPGRMRGHKSWEPSWEPPSTDIRPHSSTFKRSIYLPDLTSGNSERHRATGRISFASRGSGVQIPSAPPRSRADSDHRIGPLRSPYSGEVQQR